MRRRKLAVIPTEPWYADGLSFSCTQCGNCCTGGPGYVWISDDEIDRLAAFFKLDRETTIRRHCRVIGGRVSLKERRDERGEYPCVFLTPREIIREDGTKVTVRGCSIYEARPLQCRTWPFWDGNLEDEEAWKDTGERCPGLNRGRKYSLEQIEALRTAEDWPELTQTPTSSPASIGRGSKRRSR